MSNASSSQRRRAQRTQVATCREASPEALAALWETVLHAPSVAFPDVAALLRERYAAPRVRLEVVLRWFGHPGEECPVCRMVVGSLAYTVPAPVAELGAALDEALAAAGEVPAHEHDAALWRGAGRFVERALLPRFALPAGVDREALAELQAELAAWPRQRRLALQASWSALGGEALEVLALE
ncbi:MAG: hypothetical protein AB7N76_15300 [Planctomycetota bacterium]